MENAVKGEAGIDDDLEKKVDKKIISSFEKDEQMSRIHPTVNYENFDQIGL